MPTNRPLDVRTGEIPWVKEMMDKYEDTAKRTGSIVSDALSNENFVSELNGFFQDDFSRRV